MMGSKRMINDPKQLVRPNGTHSHTMDDEGSDSVLHKHDFDDIEHTHVFDGEDTGPGEWLLEWNPEEDD